MSQKIRLGNDIDITWSLKDAAELPYIVEGKDVAIELNVGSKKIKIKEFDLSENKIHFIFYGKDQKYTGSYVLKYIENDGKPEMVTFDTKDAFALVDHSWQAVDDGETPETIQIEIVTVASELLERVGPKGKSAYEVAVDEGFVGTEEEWLESLKGEDGEPGPEGPAGRDGSDAEVTKENIENALGYTPVQPTEITGFITRSVNDLANYYLKSETYTKSEVQALIAAIQQFHYEIYASLSDVTSPAANVLYLIGPIGTGSDKYEEYVYASGSFVKIGDTSIALSGYVTTQALNAALANYTTTQALSQLLSEKENISNKTTILSSASTDQQYPSAKAVYDAYFKKGIIRQTQTWTRAADGGYDYTMSNQVWGDIPKANIDLYTSAGAVFNEETGYFELNGLTDISYEEMRGIYNDSLPGTFPALDKRFQFTGYDKRTVIPIRGLLYNGQTRAEGMFQYAGFVEAIAFKTSITPICFTDERFVFSMCSRLKRVIGDVDLHLATNTNIALFGQALSLEEFRFRSLTKNFEMKWSSRVSIQSIVYLVENATNTSAITITLHPTAYQRCVDDTTEYTYQDNTYTGIIALANAKQITIASA